MLNVHVGATREKAMAAVRDAHDEFCRFLAPYGRFRNYLLPDGRTVRSGSSPSSKTRWSSASPRSARPTTSRR